MTVLIHTGAPKRKSEVGEQKSQKAARTVDSIPEAPQRPASKPYVRARTLSVDAVMDLAAEILWPEVRHEKPVDSCGVDTHRAQEYSLLATLLSRSPDAATLVRIAKLRGDASPFGLARLALAQAAGDACEEGAAREYFTLFIAAGRGLIPYGSYYLTGSLNEWPLARLREDLHAHGIERVEWQAGPEDHAAALCEIMAGMASGRIPVPEIVQRQFFEKHLAPWIGRFFVDLERAAAADFYRQVGSLGRLFLEIETAAFMMPTMAGARIRQERSCIR